MSRCMSCQRRFEPDEAIQCVGEPRLPDLPREVTQGDLMLGAFCVECERNDAATLARQRYLELRLEAFLKARPDRHSAMHIMDADGAHCVRLFFRTRFDTRVNGVDRSYRAALARALDGYERFVAAGEVSL